MSSDELTGQWIEDDEYVCDAPTTVRPPQSGSIPPPPPSLPPPLASSPQLVSSPRLPHEVSQTAIMSLSALPAYSPALESGARPVVSAWRDDPAIATTTVRVRNAHRSWLWTTAIASCVGALGAFAIAFVANSAPDSAMGTAKISVATFEQPGAKRIESSAPTMVVSDDAPTPKATLAYDFDITPPVAAAPAPQAPVALPIAQPISAHRAHAPQAPSPVVASPLPVAPVATAAAKTKRPQPIAMPADDETAGANAARVDAKTLLDSAL